MSSSDCPDASRTPTADTTRLAQDCAEPDELETARGILHQYNGEVSVLEDGESVFGYARLSNGAGI